MKTMEQLLALHGEDFVRTAYQVLLGREADDAGLAHYGKRLAAGEGKQAVVFALAESPEGQARLAQPIARDPAEAVAALAGTTDQAFVEGAYLRLLGREADPGGLANYLELAQAPGGRERVARELFASDEARHWRKVVVSFREDLQELVAFEKGARQLTGWWRRHERTQRRIGQLERSVAEGLQQVSRKLDQAGQRPQPLGLDGEPVAPRTGRTAAAAPAAGPHIALAPEARRLHGRLLGLSRALRGGGEH
jgi:hypothetical protein